MDVPVGAIINISGKIAEYFGLIEGVDTKVTKLLHQSFISAKMNLEYARNSSGQNQIDYIKEAKTKFIEAIAVEENENKVLALVGLAMCQIFLNDNTNAYSTLGEIDLVELTTSAYLKAGLQWNVILAPTSGIRIYRMQKAIKERYDKFEEFKSNAKYLCYFQDTSNNLSVEPTSSELDYRDIINRL